MGTPITGSVVEGGGGGKNPPRYRFRHTRSGDDDPEAAAFGLTRKLLYRFWGAVSRQGVDLKRYFLLLKPLASLLHHWKVACRTHDDTY